MSRLARSRGRWAAALVAPALAASLAAVSALARDLTAQERTALTEAANRFEVAMKDGNGTEVAAVLPPRMLQWIAKQSGGDQESVLRSTAEQIDGLREAGIRMIVKLDLAHADFESLKDGDPYVVIPTHGVVDGPKHMDIQINTLALMEDGKWYLLDISSETRLDRLRHAFPEFDGVTFGTPTTGTKP